jgi:hypothetical protein
MALGQREHPAPLAGAPRRDDHDAPRRVAAVDDHPARESSGLVGISRCSR